MDNESDVFKETLKIALKESGDDLSDVIKNCAINEDEMLDFLSGKCEDITVDNILKLARYFQVSLDWFIREKLENKSLIAGKMSLIIDQLPMDKRNEVEKVFEVLLRYPPELRVIQLKEHLKRVFHIDFDGDGNITD
jgi:transcriptional regulator with XRE-family HTH domain